MGKTTLGAALSTHLNLPVISSDSEIEQKVDQPIAAFVKQNGWPPFRAIEKSVIKDLCRRVDCIVDCGGGVVVDPENMRLLTADSLVVWVDADRKDILQRMLDDTTRPLLSGVDLKQDIEENYLRRMPLYRKYSKLRLDTSTISLEDCLGKVEQAFKKQ
ncbi:MAG: shikimate kinase [Calditrichia bacterium]